MTPLWMEEFLPKVLPFPWRVAVNAEDGRQYINQRDKISVIISIATEEDEKRWLHFSMAGKDFLPSWEELVVAKETFLGREAKAVQVLAPRSQWININPNCLHLFMCLDGDPLPDFARGGKSL